MIGLCRFRILLGLVLVCCSCGSGGFWKCFVLVVFCVVIMFKWYWNRVWWVWCWRWIRSCRGLRISGDWLIWVSFKRWRSCWLWEELGLDCWLFLLWLLILGFLLYFVFVSCGWVCRLVWVRCWSKLLCGFRRMVYLDKLFWFGWVSCWLC